MITVWLWIALAGLALLAWIGDSAERIADVVELEAEEEP